MRSHAGSEPVGSVYPPRSRRVRGLAVLGIAASIAVASACGDSGRADTSAVDITLDGVGEVPATLLKTAEARRELRDVRDEVDVEPEADAANGVGDAVSGNRVLVIGDSIMESTMVSYGAAMCTELVPRGWAVAVVAQNGEHVEYGHVVLDAHLDEGWDVAVVMLGSNYGGDQAGFEQQYAEIVARLAPRPTVLVTVTEFQESRSGVNESIRRVAAQNDHTIVVEWALETALAPSLLVGDGLHLSEAGKQRITALVGAALGDAPVASTGACLDPVPFEPPPPPPTVSSAQVD